MELHSPTIRMLHIEIGPVPRIEMVTSDPARMAATPTAGPVGTLRKKAVPANRPNIAPPQYSDTYLAAD